jgi:hypothetical protein
VITLWGTSGFSTLAEAPGVFAAVLAVYVSLIVILALAGALHPDEKCRKDAQKVLDRLLGQGERRTES